MTFVRAVLILTGATYVGLGVSFFIWPEVMTSFVGIVLSEPSARTDIRAVYGGGEIGLGLFLFICARRADYASAGLLLGALSLGGLAFFRSVSIILDGPQPAITYGLLASELLGFALNVFAYRRNPREDQDTDGIRD